MYFITITCHQWLALIEQTNGHNFLYNWFDHLKSKGHCINGYVILLNHLIRLLDYGILANQLIQLLKMGKCL